MDKFILKLPPFKNTGFCIRYKNYIYYNKKTKELILDINSFNIKLKLILNFKFNIFNKLVNINYIKWRLDLNLWETNYKILYINIYKYSINISGIIKSNYSLIKRNNKTSKYFRLVEYPKTNLYIQQFTKFIEETWKVKLYNPESEYKFSNFIKIINII